MSGKNKQLLVIAGLVIGVIIVTIIGARIRRPGPTTAPEQVPLNAPAFLIHKDTTYNPTGNLTADNLVRSDIAYFAHHKIAAYKSASSGVSFTLSGDPVANGFVVSFKGSFGALKDKVEVSVTILKNNRVKTSITDKTSNTNIDNELPSNSAFNQLIAQLPITTADYEINYVPSDSSIAVTLYEQSPTILDQAKKALAGKLGVPVSGLTKFQISYIFPRNFN